MPIKIDIQTLKERALKVDKESKSFFKAIKKSRLRELDDTIHALHEEVFDEIDCLECGNCCRSLGPRIIDKDIERMAKSMRIKPTEVIDRYLRIDEDGDYVFKSMPCPFLGDDNYCFIYEDRPKACREYPHTDRKKFHQIYALTVMNARTCPAVYEIVERLKKTFLLFLFLFLSICSLHSQKDEKLSILYQNAEKQPTSTNYLQVCRYLSNLGIASDTFGIYLEKGYKAAVEEKDDLNIGNYFLLKSDYDFMRGNTENHMEDSRKAVQIFARLKNEEGLLDAYNSMIYHFNMNKQSDSARYYCRKSLELLGGKKIPLRSSLLLHAQAISFLEENNWDSALHYQKQALEVALEMNDTIITFESYNALGVLHRKIGDIDKAIQYYEKGIEFAREKELERGVSSLYANIAVLFTNTHEADRIQEGIRYTRKALEVAKEEKNDFLIANAYSFLSRFLSQTKKPEDREEALVYARKCLELSTRLKASRFKLGAITRLVAIHDQMNHIDSVRYYLQKGNEVIEEMPQYSAEITAFREAQISMFNKNKQYREAIATGAKLEKAYQEQNTPFIHTKLYTNLATAYNGLGDYQKAYQYLQMSQELKDSIYEADHNKKMAEFSIKYQTTEKELEIAKLKQQQMEEEALVIKRRLYYLVLAAGLIILILLLLFNRQRLKARAAKLAQDAEEKEKEFITFQIESELRLTAKYIDGLEAERTRLAKELHDGVCNSLLAVEMNIREIPESNEKLQEALKLLNETNASIRSVSHALMPPALQYANIDEMLEDMIYHFKLPKGVTMDYTSTEEMDWSLIPERTGHEIYRIAQEAINNSLKHAKATHIHVLLTMEKRILQMNIIDNGKGFDNTRKEPGIGLRTMQDRAQSIQGELQIISNSEGTNIQLQLRMENS